LSAPREVASLPWLLRLRRTENDEPSDSHSEGQLAKPVFQRGKSGFARWRFALQVSQGAPHEPLPAPLPVLPRSLTLPFQQLVAGSWILTRRLIDLLPIAFGRNALVGSGLGTFVLTHLGRFLFIRTAHRLVCLNVPAWRGLFRSDDDITLPEGFDKVAD
jgi:hypothetical protein